MAKAPKDRSQLDKRYISESIAGASLKKDSWTQVAVLDYVNWTRMIFLGTLLSRTVVRKKYIIGAAGVESKNRRPEAYVLNQHLSSAVTCDIHPSCLQKGSRLSVLLVLAIPPVSGFWLLYPPRDHI